MSRKESRSLAVRRLATADREAALSIINEAARWYREFLPPEHYHEPEMTAEEWEGEARRVTWYGAFGGAEGAEGARRTLVGVMGLERIDDVALLRHAYILPGHQRTGVGSALITHLERELAPGTRVVVGTYRENFKARKALEKAGYRASPDPEAVLRQYYSIPEDRLRASVTYEKVLPDPF